MCTQFQQVLEVFTGLVLNNCPFGLGGRTSFHWLMLGRFLAGLWGMKATLRALTMVASSRSEKKTRNFVPAEKERIERITLS